jgi:hypothetical protein
MQKNYFDRVHRWGILWNIGALLMLLSIPVAISTYYNAWPEISVLWSVLSKLMLLYWVTAVIEVITYVPMLGAGGTYLSFVTGNITNLKLPVGLAAMENAKVRANTEEGEVISTIAIATSSIVTTLVMAIGVLVFRPFLDDFTNNELLKPAFAQVLPALFGALGAGYFIKHWKISIFPIAAVTVLLLFVDPGIGVLIPVGVVLSMLGAHIMYKLKLV